MDMHVGVEVYIHAFLTYTTIQEAGSVTYPVWTLQRREKSLAADEIEPSFLGRPASRLVTIPTELSQLYLPNMIQIFFIFLYHELNKRIHFLQLQQRVDCS
jgi:hypothetical protein